MYMLRMTLIKTLSSKVYNILKTLSLDESKGIAKIYRNDEIIDLGGDPKATFMIEAKRGFIL